MSIHLRLASGHVELASEALGLLRRPWVAGDREKLADHARRYAALVRTGDEAGLLVLGRELYRWLDGEQGWLGKLRQAVTAGFGLEVRGPAKPDADGWMLLMAPWELLADELGFLVEDALLGFAPVRRLGEPVTGPAADFDCNFAHLVAPTVTVRKMEAEVLTPQGSAIPFHWTVFYNFRPLAAPWNQKMTKTGDAHEFEIAAGSSSLGVQFMGPKQEPIALWAPGQYRFTVSVRTDNGSGDWKTSFSVSINSYEAGRVKDYSGWKKTDWDRWNDPDRAIGIPLIIDWSSFAMGGA